MGQACGKCEADLPCYDSRRDFGGRAVVYGEVNVQVVLNPLPNPVLGAAKQQDWDAASCGDLCDSANSNWVAKGNHKQASSIAEESYSRASTLDFERLQIYKASDAGEDLSQRGGRLYSHCGSLHGESSATHRPVKQANSPIDGLTLGAMVGRGSYGRVYKGTYNGSPVAVKVVEDVDSMLRNADGVPLEAAVTCLQEPEDQHTGIVRNLHYEFIPVGSATRERRLSSCSASSRTGSECWMLFDYCDKGCLGDAVVKGWFNSQEEADAETPQYTPDLEAVATTAHEIAGAMAHLHGLGIIHGDLSSNNIMLQSCAANRHGFTAKVGDFGNATAAAEKTNTSGSPPTRARTHAPKPTRMPTTGAISMIDETAPPRRAGTHQALSTGLSRQATRLGDQLSAQGTRQRALSELLEPAAAATSETDAAQQHEQQLSGARRYSCSNLDAPSRARLLHSRGQQRHGTVTHMAPCTLLGTTPPSEAADVYSFGVCLWEMLSGRRAWAGLSHAQVVFQVAVLRNTLEPPQGLPFTIHTLLRECLANDPKQRPTFREVTMILAHYIERGDFSSCQG